MKRVLPFLLAVVVFGQAQTVESVLRFTHLSSPPALQEAATVIRSVADIADLSIDAAQRTVTLQTTAEQLALANWLVPQLDLPAGGPRGATASFRVSGRNDDLVRVLYFRHTPAIQQAQEIATVVRSIAEIRRAFVSSAVQAFIVRGSADQIALAEWLVPKLDTTSPEENPGPHAMGGRTDDLVRVFYLNNADSSAELQEMTTVVRSIVEIRRAFTYNSAKAAVLRAPAEQIATASWLIGQLNRPSGVLKEHSDEHRMTTADPENVVRIFVLKDAPTVEELQRRALEIRRATQVRRAFTYNNHRALVMRGTAAQIALATPLAEQ